MTVGSPKPWQQYQAEAASVFKAAGCDATVDAVVTGARGPHKVDVKVVFDKHGIQCTWIVECKHWKGRVKKETVMTLRSIVDDCGADRGLIVSKRGFQSGAVRAATKTNITLTSLADLQGYIDDKDAEIEDLRRRLAAVGEQLGEYRCPHCGSDLVSRVHIDYDEKNSGLVETFECGFETGGWHERPCPFSRGFPNLDDFDLTISTDGQGVDMRYVCYAMPRTDKARSINLNIGFGRTAKEAREAVVEHYNYLITPPHQEFRGKWLRRSGYQKPDAGV